MIPHIKGLHHVTAFAGPATTNNAFFTERLGLRRVKVTVNFDNPEIYHLYYGDRPGTPGTVMTHFPVAGMIQGERGTGEVSKVTFAVPTDALEAWGDRIGGGEIVERFGEWQMLFKGPDEETLALAAIDDPRAPYDALPGEMAIRGFHSVALKLADIGATKELLQAMGFSETGQEGKTTRMAMDGPAGIIDLVHAPDAPEAVEGAGSVHHIAFATPDDNTQAKVREAVIDFGLKPTEMKDRDYFHSIYFREPGGVLFEVATMDIGFDADEPLDHLGERLCLPDQHKHLRDKLKTTLEPLPDVSLDG
ncbi:MAG TPA: dioxygenase [Maritimibacter sp.]|nr:dioxygenase [Maritimibacter sp.]